MRIPIAVQITPFDVDAAQPRIEEIRSAFVRYLEEAPRKSTRSKHGLMGPVGKILSEVKSGRRDAASLKGFAIRVHEAMTKAPSTQALQALEQGIDRLVDVLNKAPLTAHDALLDRLNYGLYFDLRKKELQSKEARRQAWVAFLRERYSDEAKLSDAWNQPVTAFDDLYLPRKAEGSRSKKATPRQKDVAAFWEAQGVAAVEEEEEGE